MSASSSAKPEGSDAIMKSGPEPVRMSTSFEGSAPTVLSICPTERWFCTLSWTEPPSVCAATSSTPSSRRSIR